MKTDYYASEFRRVILEKRLDAIVVYANGYDDRYMKALAGTYSVLQNYLLITSNSLYISEARYLVSNLKLRTTVPILAAKGENQTIKEIKIKVEPNGRIGFAGACKYADLTTLEANEYIDVTAEADQIIAHKSDEYIQFLSGYASKLSKFMDSVNISQFRKQLDVAKTLTKSVIDLGYFLSFPICVTSGSDLLQSTAMIAQDKAFRSKDVVCVDMGLKNDIFTTDRTRMYFLNNPKANSLYRQIKRVHSAIISSLVNPKLTFREIIDEYKLRFSYYPEIKKIEEEDFGHGIGFALHEQPMLEQTNSKIGKNIVFTIEPTFDTVFGKMRIEDMIAVKSDGKVVNLTS